MCGIAGFLSRSGTEDQLNKMLDAISHRGPDHAGYYYSNGVGLGNRRLKIIDLAGGNQPIFDSSNSKLVVFNGEIYNFQSIKKDLVKRGVHFKTHSDTEVILHSYLMDGLDGIAKLDGMFAVAIYDLKTQKITICRDRVGIKPLYFCFNNNDFYFSSELHSLKVAFPGQISPSPLGISLFLHRNYIAQPFSSVSEFSKLPPGHFLEVGPNGFKRSGSYLSKKFSGRVDISFDDAVDETIRLLRKSVHEQLISEVPVGVFLSSGLDSCSILSLAQEKIPARSLATYTLSFNEEDTDEAKDAEKWAKHFGSNHHNIVMTKEDLIEGYYARMRGFGEPLGAWINLGQTILARNAQKNGFKVMLSGAGGDELFCGYPTLQAGIVSKYFPNTFCRPLLSMIAKHLGQGSGNFSWQFKLKSLLNAQDRNLLKTYFNFRRLWLPEDLERLLSKDALNFIASVDPFVVFEQYFDEIRSFDTIEQFQFLDYKEFLEGSVLYGGDNAVMASSVEERVPFLSNDLIEFSNTIPSEVKFRFSETKPILRAALKKYLSSAGAQELVRGYKKKGFWLPVNAWMQDPKIQEWIRAELSSTNIDSVGFFKKEEVNRILECQFNRKSNYERQIQSLMGLNFYFRSNQFKFN